MKPDPVDPSESTLTGNTSKKRNTMDPTVINSNKRTPLMIDVCDYQAGR